MGLDKYNQHSGGEAQEEGNRALFGHMAGGGIWVVRLHVLVLLLAEWAWFRCLRAKAVPAI